MASKIYLRSAMQINSKLNFNWVQYMPFNIFFFFAFPNIHFWDKSCEIPFKYIRLSYMYLATIWTIPRTYHFLKIDSLININDWKVGVSCNVKSINHLDPKSMKQQGVSGTLSKLILSSYSEFHFKFLFIQ